MLLEGIFPAITTPFYPDGRLYFRKLEHNVDRYSRTPVAGMTVLGSTGEAVMLSDEETRDVLRTARSASDASKVLLAGIGRESLSETLRLAEFAADQRYDAVLVRTPHFYGPQMQPAAMLTYYRTLADNSPLPVVLYSIPKFTHYDLPVAVVSELAQHPNIIGIKDSSGSVERIAALVTGTRNAPRRNVDVTPVFTAVTARMLEESMLAQAALVPLTTIGGETLSAAVPAPAQPTLKTRTKEVGFQVLSGSAETILPALEAGASGAVLALAACLPQACQEVYWAWKDNDPILAAEKQQRILAASSLVAGKYGIAGIKYACDLNGYYGGRPRLPLLPLDAAAQEEIAQALVTLRP
ncbi:MULTISPECIES: dihydrodipicolinate synthase family protein [Acidobacterium]|uniref:Dihydrodipicolinate synthetase family protein n=1 Tax=Acidobacterium capsulatum (strain ATCC 51196 / DSM 11244 / BCRC 80197 / JCM 7670 / NBRC 15755 / NCIMB 13165 / 161) TaxID=240015 RepID=C1F9V1_ACIC5|nr:MULTISPECIES: dihydrodipicolinate synthase family protein [Acidobacterium]ACO31616.1 Dihydrodipicolinate synthetase family protein [Acidobacterium capsulatum ATCC 51196]HCT61694.1 dihydrodipicolinate synthase family protein [Acidobacterium sp.]